MEPVEPVQMNTYQSKTYRKDLSWLHFDNEPRVQERQQVKDPQSCIYVFESWSCFESQIDRDWYGKVTSLPPVLTNSGTSLKVRSRGMYTMLVFAVSHCMVMKRGLLETHWVVRNNNAMLRWVCSGKLCHRIPLFALRTRIFLSSIQDTVHYNRLRWFDHLQLMEESKWPKKILHLDVNDSYHRCHPKKRWFYIIRYDLHKLKLQIPLPSSDRD